MCLYWRKGIKSSCHVGGNCHIIILPCHVIMPYWRRLTHNPTLPHYYTMFEEIAISLTPHHWCHTIIIHRGSLDASIHHHMEFDHRRPLWLKNLIWIGVCLVCLFIYLFYFNSSFCKRIECTYTTHCAPHNVMNVC